MRVNRAEADGANEAGQSLELEQIFSSCPGPIEANWSFPEKPPVLLQLSRFNPLQAPFNLFIILHLPIMSETFQELADIPKDFIREGSQFVRRCTKRMLIGSHLGCSLTR